MDFFLNVLANLILQTYFNNSRCLLILNDIQNPVNYTGTIPTVKITTPLSNHSEKNIFHYFGCQDIIIRSNYPVSVFDNFETMIRFNMERFNHRRYLFLPTGTQKEKFGDISKLQALNYVSDVLLVSPQVHQRVFYLRTHKYVGRTDNNKIYLLDKWTWDNQSFARNRNLFPDKLSDQKGRVLRMATFQYEPYSIIGDSVDQYRGSEMMTGVMYAKKYNMTPVPIVNEKDYWGEIFDNWSGNGLLGNLADDKADIGFSALYTWEVDYHFLDLSKPLVRTGITCLVPAPKLAAGWFTPLFSYSYEMWKVVVVLFFTCIFSLFLMNICYLRNKTMRERYGQSKQKLQSIIQIITNATFTVSKLFILQNLTKSEVPYGAIGRTLMGTLFLMSLFLTSTYSSGLASIMTIPRYENPINSVQEFVASNLHWGATQDAWITSIEKAEEPNYVKIVSRFVPTSEEELRELSLSEHFAFSLERLPNSNYAIGTYIKDDIITKFHLMQQDFYWEQCVIMTKKSSILMPSLDQFILRVFQAGLISVWQNEAVALYMDPIVQKAVKYYAHHAQEKHVIKLKLLHVEGAFAVLIFGYILGVIVFVFEMINRRTRLNFIH